MQIGNISKASIAAAVWATSTKAISSLGSALAFSAGANQSLPASSNTTFSFGAGNPALCYVAVQAGAAGASVFQINDGTRVFTASTVVAGASGVSQLVLTGNTVTLVLSNADAANAAKYAFEAIILS